jgi:hypothetical protein
MKNKKRRVGVCPSCGGIDSLVYGDYVVIDGDSGYFPFVCADGCLTEGREYYQTKYKETLTKGEYND